MKRPGGPAYNPSIVIQAKSTTGQELKVTTTVLDARITQHKDNTSYIYIPQLHKGHLVITDSITMTKI